MIVWAAKQDPNDEANYADMEEAIHAGWYCEHCSLCKFFDDDCDACVMDPTCDHHGPAGDADDSEGVGQWVKVQRAATWGDWVTEAGVMLYNLEQLYVKHIGKRVPKRA